jgi:MFS family permease
MPLLAFFNRRTILAVCALFLQYAIVTLTLPFIADEHRVRAIATSTICVLIAFLVCTWCARFTASVIGAKRLTLIGLALSAVGSYLLTLRTLKQVEGNLLFAVAASFSPACAYKEILSGTQARLIKSRYKLATTELLLNQTAYLTHAVIQVAFVAGPLLGAYISSAKQIDALNKERLKFSIYVLLVYPCLAYMVHFLQKWDEARDLDLSECD